MTTLPKFKMKPLSAELLADVNTTQRKKGLVPGDYELTVGEVKVSETPVPFDADWYNLTVQFTVGDSKIYGKFLMPIAMDPKLGFLLAQKDGDQVKAAQAGKREAGKLIRFLTALGLDGGDIAGSMAALVKDGVGKTVGANLDYMDTRIVGEGEGEGRQYFFQYASGKPILDLDTGLVKYFPDIDSAKAYGELKKIRNFNGVSPKSYKSPKVANKFGGKGAKADW